MKKLISLFIVFATFLGVTLGKTVYVNANHPANGNGTSWSSPYTNLQTAVTAAVVGDLVLVTNGVYSPITTGNKAITIQSVEGYANTIIDARQASRCAELGRSVKLVGFTLVNGSSASEGGGVYGPGAVGIYNPTVYNCLITNCSTTSTSGGGGIRGCNNYSNIIVGCSSLSNGGGTRYGFFTDCVISGNTANYGGGSSGGTLTGCVISGNTANQNGGGDSGSTLTGCTISGNTANQRGGGFNASTLFNSVISNNIAVVNGGGGYNGRINSCLVVGNTAPVGSQIRNQDINFYAYNSTIIGECSFPNSTKDIVNNIFYGADITFPPTAQVGFNTFGGTLTGGTIVGPNLASTDPQFTDPANNDFTLLPTSPCINKGANQYVTTATDLLGSPRIKDWRVDMGAYESQSTRFVTTPNALFPMGTKDVVGSQYVLRTYHYGSPTIEESPDDWFGFDPGTGTITNFNYEAGRENVVIPWEIGGVAVEAIGANAFSPAVNGTPVETMIGPKTVLSVGDNAFTLCTSLTSVSFPAATSLKYRAFYYCTALPSVSLPAATAIGSGAFASCRSLASISLPAATSIASYAFSSCSSLTSVYFGTVNPAGPYHVFNIDVTVYYPTGASEWSGVTTWCGQPTAPYTPPAP